MMNITIAQLRFWREECEWSYNDISNHTGIPVTTIATRCQRLKLHPKNKINARERWRDHAKLVKHGNISPKLIEYLYWDCEKPTREVAEILKIPKRSLISVMKYHGIPRRTHSEASKLKARGQIANATDKAA